jgi:hypothetical protein
MWKPGGRPQTTVTRYRQGDEPTFATLLCEGYVCHHLGSLAALLDQLSVLSAQHPGHRLLATLDHVDQACYTSGHTIQAHDLDATEGYDLSNLEPALFENGEHQGYLSTPAEFPIRLSNFKAKCDLVAFEDCAALLFFDRNDGAELFEHLANPDALVDQTVYIQIVPVLRAWEAIAAFPNGYFVDDLSPMQLAALARRLEERHNYSVVAIGASWVAFKRSTELHLRAARALAEDIATIYKRDRHDFPVHRLAAHVMTKDWLVLNYSGS